jgi:hypothetical protein
MRPESELRGTLDCPKLAAIRTGKACALPVPSHHCYCMRTLPTEHLSGISYCMMCYDIHKVTLALLSQCVTQDHANTVDPPSQ